MCGTYEEAVKYILDIPRFTKKNDLVHTKRFLKYLGNPQEDLKILHVAGTNGKGSVCFYLDAMLRSEGKRTGLFTSPHLERMNERIVINGEQIGDREFEMVFQETLEAVKKMQDEVFDVEVQYCDPDDCLHDCVVSGNNCDANILSIW